MDDEEGLQDEDHISPDGRVKRRRVDAFDEQTFSPRMVASFELSKGKRKMDSLYNVPGKQMSVFQALQKRQLGLRASSAQGECCVGVAVVVDRADA